jgi:hypothetical protein
MPSKQPSLFGTSFEEPPKEKLPTLLQYLKRTKDVEYPLLRRIDFIWLPGSFSNYTLQTSDFRIAISSGNPLYKLLDGVGWKQVVESESAILASCLDSKGTIELVQSNVYGTYVAVGGYGVKFVPTDGAN